MPLKDYFVRTMRSNEISILIDWATAEGWNPGLMDAGCFYNTDPTGFLIGELNHKPVATISAVKYGESFGFLGFYMVKPEYRKKGYGIKIWKAGLKYLEGRNIGLDGVVEQQDNYKKSGFKPAYRNIRLEGISGGSKPENADTVRLSEIPFKTIDAYDRPFFPATRSSFLKSWISQPGSYAIGIKQEGQLGGYGVIRECRVGYKIGPLFADTAKLAESLFLTLKSIVSPLKPIYLDVPEVNLEAIKLGERHQMKTVFETARMYTKETPNFPHHRLYGVTTFELG